MTPAPIERSIILVRLDGIQGEVQEMQTLAKQSKHDFTKGPGHKLAAYHLHRTLEGVFNIASHILSRLPGEAAHSYKEIALGLGKRNIVPVPFSQGPLVKMAGYRNRLVHFYAEVTPDELYDVITHHLNDVDTFCQAIKAVLAHPEQWGLHVE